VTGTRVQHAALTYSGDGYSHIDSADAGPPVVPGLLSLLGKKDKDSYLVDRVVAGWLQPCSWLQEEREVRMQRVGGCRILGAAW
jgi:hypothetical protein